MDTTRELLHLLLDNYVLVPANVLYIPTSFVRNTVLFEEGFKYDDGAKVWDYVGTNAVKRCQNSVIFAIS
jgi:hypothetical protein